MQYGPLVICVDYDKELLSRNMAVVVFIVSKHDNKVRYVSVVERPALASWYAQKITQFSQERHNFVISTTSIVGQIVALLPDKTSEYKPHNSSVN